MRRVRECAGKGSKASAFTGIDEVLGPPSSEGLYHSLPADNWSCQPRRRNIFSCQQIQPDSFGGCCASFYLLGEKILIDNATFFSSFFSFAMLGIEPKSLNNLGKYSYH